MAGNNTKRANFSLVTHITSLMILPFGIHEVILRLTGSPIISKIILVVIGLLVWGLAGILKSMGKLYWRKRFHVYDAKHMDAGLRMELCETQLGLYNAYLFSFIMIMVIMIFAEPPKEVVGSVFAASVIGLYLHTIKKQKDVLEAYYQAEKVLFLDRDKPSDRQVKFYDGWDEKFGGNILVLILNLALFIYLFGAASLIAFLPVLVMGGAIVILVKLLGL